ncbi:protein FAR1-RELATED SEQUENCE 5-like [Silene latifolia]|uniref:protein FAR1-RELATED SEQUENCE 5-like n=1 Tax=Silene latifolia TaxID=37657 RepID=UPI003D77D281
MDSDSTENTMRAVFSSLEAGIKFYGVYARACGFTPRKYIAKNLRGGITHQKFIVCNRQGFRGNKQKLRSIPVDEHNNGDSSSTVETVERHVKITRIGCTTYVRFALLNGLEGPTMIDDFSEFHNHHLTSVSNRDLKNISRCLDMFHKQLILDNSKFSIGAAKTFRQVKELVHGYENIGATLVDFKNFQRDIKCYIGERDADLFLDRLEKLKTTQPQFYFAYDVDASNCLTKVIWTDSTSIRNYSFFGDAVSFDPTYGTNKYDMMFQEEVKAAISCGITDFDKEDNLRIIFVEDPESNKTFKVTFNLSTTNAECACKLFEKIGLLCRHIVWVYKGKGIQQIPSKYILDRWAKNFHVTNRLDPNGNVIEDSNMAQSNNSLV